MTTGTQLGFIVENLGGFEVIAIVLVALIVLGPERLPDTMRSIGRAIAKARTYTESFSGDVREMIDDPAMQPIRELGEFAVRPRQKLAEYALEAEAEERARKAAETPGEATEEPDLVDTVPDTSGAAGETPASPEISAAAGNTPASPEFSGAAGETPAPSETTEPSEATETPLDGDPA